MRELGRETGSSPELKEVKIEDMIITYREKTGGTPGFFPEEEMVRLDWRPIESVLTDSPSRVFAFRTCKQASGTLNIEGKELSFVSQTFEVSRTTWLDAEVHTIDEVKAQLKLEKK